MILVLFLARKCRGAARRVERSMTKERTPSKAQLVFCPSLTAGLQHLPDLDNRHDIRRSTPHLQVAGFAGSGQEPSLTIATSPSKSPGRGCSPSILTMGFLEDHRNSRRAHLKHTP